VVTLVWIYASIFQPGTMPGMVLGPWP
jgi:hypothetical protein